MCHLCVWLKLFFKKCGRRKNKKHRVGLSVGLLAVQLQYGLYVLGHRSKWFVFVLMLNFGRSIVILSLIHPEIFIPENPFLLIFKIFRAIFFSILTYVMFFRFFAKKFSDEHMTPILEDFPRVVLGSDDGGVRALFNS